MRKSLTHASEPDKRDSYNKIYQDIPMIREIFLDVRFNLKILA